ncbi:carbohydrate ABC transporter permease [Streptomyces sp. 6N223]|uniref:carbohydrate ABC transporter permease n=1 Tax=Streptomyces sp. 6N223 TaxID=3457412 RepID=UPI003FD2ED4B
MTTTKAASQRSTASRRSGSSATTRPTTGMLFVAPTALVVAVLFLAPLALLVYMSFTDWPLLGSPQVNGVENYTDIAADDVFLGAIGFTLLYTVLTTALLAAATAVLVTISNSQRRGSRIYRTAFFLPYVVGMAAASLLWFVNYNDQVGVYNMILEAVGVINEPVGFLDTPNKALFSVVVLVVWKTIGFQVVVLLVGLQAIPAELDEAARIDGASTLQRLRHITLPMLRPTIALLLILSITGSLLGFDQFLVLTQGGPDNSTITMVYALYKRAFSSFELGAAAALSIVLLLALIVLNVIQLRFLRSKDS